MVKAGEKGGKVKPSFKAFMDQDDEVEEGTSPPCTPADKLALDSAEVQM